ncbi:hypothetical protein WMW72_28210, partial [Paenibacillus filicis]
LLIGVSIAAWARLVVVTNYLNGIIILRVHVGPSFVQQILYDILAETYILIPSRLDLKTVNACFPRSLYLFFAAYCDSFPLFSHK